MRVASSRLGWILAALNVVALCGFLAARAPEYELLNARDEKFWITANVELSTGDPLHLAGRPFDSSAHVSGVPFFEDLYFVLNAPAMYGALLVSYPASSFTFEWWTGSNRTPSAWESWALAIIFGSFGALRAFVLGATIDWWRSERSLNG
jgi:hypothetical protein